MTDMHPASVPDLSEEWIASQRSALVESLSEPRHKPMKWAALAGATGVATATTVSTLVLVGGSAQYAFAGWSATPTRPAHGQLTAADNDCQAQLSQLPPTNKGADASSFVPELSDVRGPYTVTFLGDGGNQDGVVCVSGLGTTSVRWIGGSGAAVAPGTIAADQVSLLSRDGEQYTLVVGQIGSGVTGVSLSLSDGTNVTATSGSGFFVAWWPMTEDVTSANVSTASGVSTQNFNLIVPPVGTKSPPPPSGTGSVSSNGQTVCLIHSCG